ITHVIASVALASHALAVTPAPDGGYPGGNTAEGNQALYSLNTNAGVGNTAVGDSTLLILQSGNFNTAVGSAVLNNNVVSYNTGLGATALVSNTQGELNTAIGYGTMNACSTGTQNTAIRAEALHSSYNDRTPLGTGSLNTATGYRSLYSNKNGGSNVANGWQALYSKTSGGSNTDTGGTSVNETSN